MLVRIMFFTAFFQNAEIHPEAILRQMCRLILEVSTIFDVCQQKPVEVPVPADVCQNP